MLKTPHFSIVLHIIRLSMLWRTFIAITSESWKHYIIYITRGHRTCLANLEFSDIETDQGRNIYTTEISIV